MHGNGKKRAVLIAGPTASGKTARAIEMARGRDAVIINTDSMQVYGVLDRLTARPNAEEQAAAQHVLFGHVDPARRYSTGAWLADVQQMIQGAVAEGWELIFVGGTGLYFDALTKGFADMPEIPDELVLDVQQEIQALDEAARMALLVEADPVAARRLKVADPQRVIRALAVRRATGRPLSSFQEDQKPGLLEGWAVERMVLWPGRDVLRDRIARRFETMLEGGAVAEVEALRAQALDPSLPAMKAIGVPEISGWLDGVYSREEAVALAITATRQYAKRQRTWFRNRMGDWPLMGLEGGPFRA